MGKMTKILLETKKLFEQEEVLGRIGVSYEEPSQGNQFYGLYLYPKDQTGMHYKKFSSVEEANQFLEKLGIETNLPSDYSFDVLEKIGQELQAKGVEFDHDEAMDVS